MIPQSGRVRAAAGLGLLLCVLVAVPSALLASVSPSLQQTVLVTMASLILVVSLYIFSGNSGVLSFGHLALAMVGGYTGAITSIESETKELLYPGMWGPLQNVHFGQVGAILAGGVAAALAGAVLALLLARLSGLTAGLATFVVLLIAVSVATGLEPVTNGSSGLTDVARITEYGQVLPWTLVAVLTAAAYQASRSCQRLRASREDEVAAASVGVNVQRERTVGFICSAAVAGMGGAVYVQVIGTVSPTLFYLALTTTIIAMLVIGGIGSLTGAVIGTLAIAVLNETMNRLENGIVFSTWMVKSPAGLQQVCLAVAMLLILMWRPEGLMRGRELSVRWRGRRPRVDELNSINSRSAA